MSNFAKPKGIGCVAGTGIAIFVIVIFGGLLAQACNMFAASSGLPPIVETARARLQLGEQREAALSAFSDAWFHGDCTLSDGSGFDLFFYGPKNRSEVRIVLLRYDIVNGKATVAFIGTLENYRLSLYERCIPKEIFED